MDCLFVVQQYIYSYMCVHMHIYIHTHTHIIFIYYICTKLYIYWGHEPIWIIHTKSKECSQPTDINWRSFRFSEKAAKAKASVESGWLTDFKSDISCQTCISLYINMYYRLFWSCKLGKYGESSANAILSNIHRTKAGSVAAKAPWKDLPKYHVSKWG